MDYVILDLETTGLDIESSSIIEVAALLVRNGKVTDEFTSLVNYQGVLSPAIRRLTGIADDDLKRAPVIDEVLSKLRTFIGDLPVVGHNLPDFDARILARWGLKLDDIHDSLEFAFFVLPTSPSGHSVDALATRYGLNRGQHRALDDCKITQEVIKLLASDYKGRSARERRFLKGLMERIGWWWAWAVPSGSEDVESIGDLVDAYEPYRKKNADQGMLPLAGGKIDRAEMLRYFDVGLLKAETEYAEDRPLQRNMAELVAETLNERKVTIIEAGTGVGKTKAYLVPAALFALKNNLPVIVATKTKILQDQLFDKEIPHLERVLGKKLRVVLVKGKQNYVCLSKFDDFTEEVTQRSTDRSLYQRTKDGTMFTLPLAHLLLASWVCRTERGDWDEISSWLEHKIPKKAKESMINSDDLCSRGTCEHHEAKKCFLSKARWGAKDADLVIANHAILLTGLEVQQDINQPLVHPVFPGEAKFLIIDEAHHLEDTATDAWSSCISSSILAQVRDWLFGNRGIEQILRSESSEIGRSSQAASALSSLMNQKQNFDLATGSLIATAEAVVGAGGRSPEYSSSVDFRDQAHAVIMQSVITALTDFSERISAIVHDITNILDHDVLSGDAEKKVVRLTDRLVTFNNTTVRRLAEYTDPTYVRYVETFAKEVSLKAAPLSVAEELASKVYGNFYGVAMTSATVTVGGGFGFAQSRFGLNLVDDDRLKCVNLGSVFDFGKQVQFFVPIGISYDHRKKSEHYERCLGFLKDGVLASNGGSLILCTSREDVRKYCDALEGHFSENNLPLYCQLPGRFSKTTVNVFRDEMNSILIGTRKLWEGIDVPGPSLRSLFIVRLPFEPLGRPLLKSRMDQIDAAGGNGYKDYYEPLAALTLKQGFGRLIRKSTDHGIAVLLDERLATKPELLRSLPDGVKVVRAPVGVIVSALQKLAIF